MRNGKASQWDLILTVFSTVNWITFADYIAPNETKAQTKGTWKAFSHKTQHKYCWRGYLENVVLSLEWLSVVIVLLCETKWKEAWSTQVENPLIVRNHYYTGSLISQFIFSHQHQVRRQLENFGNIFGYLFWVFLGSPWNDIFLEQKLFLMNS